MLVMQGNTNYIPVFSLIRNHSSLYAVTQIRFSEDGQRKYRANFVRILPILQRKRSHVKVCLPVSALTFGMSHLSKWSISVRWMGRRMGHNKQSKGCRTDKVRFSFSGKVKEVCQTFSNPLSIILHDARAIINQDYTVCRRGGWYSGLVIITMFGHDMDLQRHYQLFHILKIMCCSAAV